MDNKQKRRWNHRKNITATFAGALVFATGASWVADSVEWDGFMFKADMFSVGLLLFLMGSALTYRFGSRLLPITSLKQSSTPNPNKVLVMFLSEKRGYELERGEEGWVLRFNKQGHETEEIKPVALPSSLDEVIELKPPRNWSWQQTLRAVHAHPGVERIYLIGSSENQGSFKDISLACDLIKSYVPDVTIETRPVTGEGVHFEDMGNLMDELQSIIEHAEKAGYEEKDIMIDVTGGQKTTSIAGALVTVHYPRLEFQYISTNKPYKAIRFNAVTEKGKEL